MKLFTKKAGIMSVVIFFSFLMIVSGQQITKAKPVVLKSMVKAELTATEKYYVGVCPVKVKMTGIIKVPKAMNVKYSFLRSDGASSRLSSLNFTTAGSKSVNFTWTIGKDYLGWVQLIVKTNGTEVKSNKVEFEVKCDKIIIKPLNQLQTQPLAAEPKLIKRSIKVIYPNGGETFIYMRHHENNYIKWTSENARNVNIWLMQEGQKVHGIVMSDLGIGGEWYCGWDTHEFTQRFYPGTNYKIRVESLDGKVWDESDEFFTIEKAK